jgi:hypothetical protein
MEFLVKKSVFFLKNLKIHEKTDKFRMNLRGYPTISTKLGFKSITIPDSLYWVLSTTAKINKIRIGKVIEQGVLGGSPPTPEAQVLSGLYYEPIPLL